MVITAFASMPHIAYTASGSSDGDLVDTAADTVGNFGPYGAVIGGAMKMINGALKKSVVTLTSWVQQQSPASAVSRMFLYILEYTGNALATLNSNLFGKAFGLLMVYMDYTRMPQIQSEFNNLYGLIAKIAYTLIALFVIVSLLLHTTKALFQDSGAKFASAGGVLAVSVVVSVALISSTPVIFSKTTGLMQTMCFEIMFHKVKGENVDYSTAINLSNSAPTDFFSNTVNEAISKLKLTAGNVVDKMKMTYVQPMEDKVNEAIGDPSDKLNTYIQNEIPILRTAATNSDDQVNREFTDKARVIVLKIFVSIASISMLLTLLCLKGVQLLSLFVMLLIAPLVTMFLILPQGYKLVINFWKEILGLLSAPIVWAIMIKIYFLIKAALGDSTAGSIVSASDFSLESDQKLLILFMELAILVSMLSVTAIIGKVLIASTIANAQAMAGMLSGVPAAVGGLIGGAVGAGTGAAAFGALMQKHGSFGKAIMGMSSHGGKYFGAKAQDNAGGSGNSNSNRNNINQMASSFKNNMQAGSTHAQARSAHTQAGSANASQQSRSISSTEYNGQNLPQYGGYWDNYLKKQQQNKPTEALPNTAQNGAAKPIATDAKNQGSSVNRPSAAKTSSGGKINAA
jgi:hypothetical protein